MRKIVKKMVPLLLIFSMVVSGCSVAPVEGTSDNTSLSVALANRPSSLDPQMANDVMSKICLNPVCDTLFRMTDDNVPVLAMAESYDMSSDGLTYTFHLRDNLRFSNGDPITAEDFAFAFRRIADPTEGSSAIRVISDSCLVKNAAAINKGEMPMDQLGVSAPDDRTLVIELEKPCPRMEYVLADMAFTPCQEKFYDSCSGHYSSSPETMLASGAFYIDRYTPLGTQIHFKKNPYYYDADEIRLEEITYQCVSDPQQSNMCYQTGLVDITDIKAEFLKLAEGDDSLQKNTTGLFDFASINERSPQEACRNVNIRLALANAIQRDVICDKLLYGTGVPMTRLFSKDIWMNKAGEDVAADQEKFKDICTYNPDRARELFDKGLQELGVDSLKLKVIAKQSRAQMAEVIKDEWEKEFPKLKITVQIMQNAQLLEEMMGDGYDIVLMGVTVDTTEPTGTLDIFKTGYSMNMTGYSNPELDEILEALKYEMDEEKQIRMANEAEEIIMNDMPLIPIFSTGSAWLVADTVKGFKAPGDAMINVSRVWKEG